MTMKNTTRIAAIALTFCLAGTLALLNAQQRATGEVAIGNAALGGVVSDFNDPEAGVCVIAETADLPTKSATMVVTDDHGRYGIPPPTKAKYEVWVLGYGLVDSPKVKAV